MAAESKRKIPLWLIGLGLILVIIIVPIFIFLPRAEAKDDAWANVPVRPPHTDHTSLLQGPFTTGSEVTRACLECHPEAAQQVMGTVHWTWESQPYDIPGRDEPVTIGKKNQINNFCIGIQGNWNSCTILPCRLRLAGRGFRLHRPGECGLPGMSRPDRYLCQGLPAVTRQKGWICWL